MHGAIRIMAKETHGMLVHFPLAFGILEDPPPPPVLSPTTTAFLGGCGLHLGMRAGMELPMAQEWLTEMGIRLQLCSDLPSMMAAVSGRPAVDQQRTSRWAKRKERRGGALSNKGQRC